MRINRISLATIFGLLIWALPPAQVAQAAITCMPTTAVAKSPKVIPAPTRTLTSFPSLLTFKTNCGDIDIELIANAAPITTSAILTLARGGYYDGTLCHRLTTAGIFVIQCGDPLATGMGGPGWTFADENLPSSAKNNYPAGTIAMANAGPGTNGSQFFFTYKDSTIAPNYTIWGRVISGLDILTFIASKGVVGGSAVDGAPALSLGIDSVEEGDPYALRMFNKGIKQGTEGIASLKSELDSSKKSLISTVELNKSLQSKLKRICSAKPKPKGC